MGGNFTVQFLWHFTSTHTLYAVLFLAMLCHLCIGMAIIKAKYMHHNHSERRKIERKENKAKKVNNVHAFCSRVKCDMWYVCVDSQHSLYTIRYIYEHVTISKRPFIYLMSTMANSSFVIVFLSFSSFAHLLILWMWARSVFFHNVYI